MENITNQYTFKNSDVIKNINDDFTSIATG